MDISLLMLLGSAGGGILGAAMGGLPSITLWGAVLMIAGLAGVVMGKPNMVWDIGFNPLFGAHIVYAGGAAAAAYACYKKVLDSGLDVLKPLSGFGRADVLIVGGFFGVLGMIVERYCTSIGVPTDNVALSVVITGWVARLLFDRGWLKSRREKGSGQRWYPTGKDLASLITLGAGVGLAGGIAAVKIGDPLLPFGLALLFLAYLQMGFKGMAWHHIVLISGITALQGHGSTNAMVWAVIMGIVVAITSDCVGRLWIRDTNSYIDPPVTSIMIGRTIVIVLTAVHLL